MRLSLTALMGLLLLIACSTEQRSLQSNSDNSTALAINVSYPLLTDSSFSQAEFAEHIAQLKKKVPTAGFSIVVQPPFVVIGDEPREVVQAHATETIKWAVEKLKEDYFTKDPDEILDIWLFKDAASYEKHTRLIFNDKPSTPYGYYSRGHKALIMNISTGAGTLVHELVHPFIEANFPSCPSWFNEGLGSLYEHCGEQDGHIHGFVNWRLPGLQQAIKDGRVRPIQELTAMNPTLFYSDSRGVNYAESRYLLYYLQEKNLLTDFYHRFLSQQKTDPTGYRSLTQILGNPDMNRFEKMWEKYVLNLHEEFSFQHAN